MKTIIPEEIFIKCIKSANNGDLQAEGVCPECEKMIKFKYYPYEWDPRDSTVTYMGICPECGKPIYVFDYI